MGRSLLRAIVLGLGLGAFAGGALLASQTVRSLARASDCAGLSTEECALEKETFGYLAKRQGIGAVGLFVLGAGLVMLSRRRPEDDGDGGGSP